MLLIAPVVAGQPSSASGRVTLRGFLQSTTAGDGEARDFSEVALSFALRSPLTDSEGLEYAFDARSSAYPSTASRDPRNRIYDAWVGGKALAGALRFRAGQMRLHELGAVGSVGGAMAEYRTRPDGASHLRVGLFGGAEPKNFTAGFEDGIRKGGGWLAFDGSANRRHVLGYVNIRHSGLTERSVLTTMNFIPAGKVFSLYQTAEYDVSGPAGEGDGGLNYFFANGRLHPRRQLEMSITIHRGRSIDARRITDEILDGRPVDPRALEGFLFESAGARVTWEALRNVRIHAGYSRDRNNREDESAGRITAGLWAANVGGSGFDITLSDNRIERGDESYDAWYASVGRSIGSRVYLSADYSTSFSVIRVLGGDGTVIETRPEAKRYGVNAIWHVSRAVSAVLAAEHDSDTNAESDRTSLGLTYRW
jgi:hypothetical protein